MFAIATDQAPAQSCEGVFLADGTPVGLITSAAWGFRVHKNLAMAYIDPEHAKEGTTLCVHLLGTPVNAAVCSLCLLDPAATIPRGDISDT